MAVADDLDDGHCRGNAKVQVCQPLCWLHRMKIRKPASFYVAGFLICSLVVESNRLLNRPFTSLRTPAPQDVSVRQ